MNKNDLKNIVVLKNLPSNIVDEAIVILKSNKKIKKIEVADKKNLKISNTVPKNNMYVINEAEMIVNDYISKLENKEEKKEACSLIKEKYKRLKKYSCISSIILLMSIILHFI